MSNVLSAVERINKLEVELTAFNSQRALYQEHTELEIQKMGDSTLLIDRNVPGSMYYNRIKGFGMNDLHRIDDILGVYESEQISPIFDMTPAHLTMDVSLALMDKGFFCFEQMVFLELEPHPTTKVNADIDIELVTEQNVAEFLGLLELSSGQEIAKDMIDKKAKYFFRSDFQNYIAYIGGEPAGMGSLFIKEEEGYIANAFTFPSFRGMGVQKELLNHRIQAANELGLEKLITDVEFGSISHDNMLKLGFRTVFINSFWKRA